MNLIAELQQSRKNHFVVLILDNEVTVGEFVIEPPLPWSRIVQQDGLFQFAAGYPNILVAQQAKFEMTNWDQVSLPGIKRWLGELGAALDFVVIGNNAGQGLPLAQALSQELRATRAAIIYAAGLPEQRFYEKLGYRHFFRRDETAPQMVRLAAQENRPLALYFLNTIQHNSSNYHVP